MTHIQTGETYARSWPLLIETFIITAASMTIAILEKCPHPASWWAKLPNTHLWNLTSSSYPIDTLCVCVCVCVSQCVCVCVCECVCECAVCVHLLHMTFHTVRHLELSRTCLHHVLAFSFFLYAFLLLITFPSLCTVMCVILCLFSALSHKVGALQN